MSAPAPEAVKAVPSSKSSDGEKLIMPTFSFLTRISLWTRLMGFKLFVKCLIGFYRIARPLPAACKPTLLKTYPVRPGLVNRVFFPATYKPGMLLPLYLDIHGGGFCIMDPQVDDLFCVQLAQATGALVVSLNYHKGPASRYPGPVNDVYEIAQAVINDESLPIDKSRIAVGGFSAGGNLSLAIAQKAPLNKLIKAVVAYYPAVDMTTTIPYKISTRPLTEKPDMLEKSGVLFDWGYVPAGYDRRDPILCPTFAKRSALPEYLYLIGAEEDMLCEEAVAMARKMAGVKERGNKIEGVALEDGWEVDGVRCEIMRKCEHSFTHMPQANPEREAFRQAQFKGLQERVKTWLLEGPFKV
jgi:acetyl esterase/lipase